MKLRVPPPSRLLHKMHPNALFGPVVVFLSIFYQKETVALRAFLAYTLGILWDIFGKKWERAHVFPRKGPAYGRDSLQTTATNC